MGLNELGQRTSVILGVNSSGSGIDVVNLALADKGEQLGQIGRCHFSADVLDVGTTDAFVENGYASFESHTASLGATDVEADHDPGMPDGRRNHGWRRAIVRVMHVKSVRGASQ